MKRKKQILLLPLIPLVLLMGMIVFNTPQPADTNQLQVVEGNLPKQDGLYLVELAGKHDSHLSLLTFEAGKWLELPDNYKVVSFIDLDKLQKKHLTQ